MKSWFLINLGDAILAYDKQDSITQLLSTAYAEAGSPNDMAAFIRHEAEGRLHCEVKIYLSPMSDHIVNDVIAQNLEAVNIQVIPCHKPSYSGLSLIAGPQAAIPALFPESDS